VFWADDTQRPRSYNMGNADDDADDDELYSEEENDVGGRLLDEDEYDGRTPVGSIAFVFSGKEVTLPAARQDNRQDWDGELSMDAVVAVWTRSVANAFSSSPESHEVFTGWMADNVRVCLSTLIATNVTV